MASIIFYDIIFLVLFTLFIGLFFYKNRKNVKRELGIAFLYKSQWGVRMINHIGKKYRKTLNFLRYPIIFVGYFLMIVVLFLISRAAWVYVRHPILVTDIIKAPPIAPVIPYFPRLFGLESFFPPLYFAYFIIALAIVAIVHEGAHGIYMAFNKVRIKSTGVLALGPLLGAFVEQDERDMNKIKKRDQMTILAAGVFANVLIAIIFFFIWWLLFSVTFNPMGATFDNYVFGIVPISSINSIGGIFVDNPTNEGLIEIIDLNKLSDDLALDINGQIKFTEVEANGKSYLITISLLSEQLKLQGENVALYEDLPAINSRLRGTIIEIDNKNIRTHRDLVDSLAAKRPSDKINIKTSYGEEVIEYNLVLGVNPRDNTKPMLGIANNPNLILNTADFLAFFKSNFTEYKINGEFLLFFYYMAFWIFFLNIAVAIFNMLPLGVLDGGRFFYLTVWGITGSEKTGKKVYSWAGRIILFIFVIMMLSWLFGITN